jgi:hypothetical protein
LKISDFRIDLREEVRNFEKFIIEGGQAYTEDMSYEDWFTLFVEYQK